MKVVILAGGLGTRLREETEIRPKPMVEIGGLPVIWHIMTNYSNYSHKEFIICAGYKSEVIKNWFLNMRVNKSDIKIKFNSQQSIEFLDENPEDGWSVLISNTGAETQTGGRLFGVQKYVGKETFLCTYGDGIGNIDIEELLKFHKSHGKIATITTIKPKTRFGILDMVGDKVFSFDEKPTTDTWVNAGYFVFEPEIFDYLNSNSILELDPLMNLANNGELMAYRHEGFWHSMDTYRDKLVLEDLWNSNKPPWLFN